MFISSIWVWNFIAIWQGVLHRVVEKAVVAISPWEFVAADAQMFVWDELCARLILVLHVVQIGIDHSQSDARECNVE